MGLRSNGGVLGPQTVPALTASSGVWNLRAQQRSQGAGIWPVSPTDVALLRFDGADASTTFTDSAPISKTYTAFGNAQIDTAIYKYGTGSGLFDGSDYVAADNVHTLSADFTVEFWMYVLGTVGSASYGVVDLRSSNSAAHPFFTLTNGTNLQIYVNGASRFGNITITSSTWTHIALTRSGGTCRAFKDGTQQGSNYTFSTSLALSHVTLGSFVDQRNTNANYHYYGHLDDFRITQGTAHYTANFTPPGAL